MVLTVLAIGLALGCVWRFSAWHERLGFSTLVHWGKIWQGRPETPIVLIGMFMLAGLLFAHAVLLWAVVFTFDMPHAMLYCELGSLASAFLLYGLGRVLRQDVVRRIAGSYTGDISRALARKGILSLFLLHLFPICPYSMLNLVAGATHISWKDFTIGTVLGITPGIIVLCLFGARFMQLLQHPNWEGFLGLAVFLLAGLPFWPGCAAVFGPPWMSRHEAVSLDLCRDPSFQGNPAAKSFWRSPA